MTTATEQTSAAALAPVTAQPVMLVQFTRREHDVPDQPANGRAAEVVRRSRPTRNRAWEQAQEVRR